MKTYVLDTSALLTLHLNESGSDIVEDILTQAQKHKAHVLTSFITWAEIYYITKQRFGADRALESLVQMKCLPIKRVESEHSMTLIAGDLKSQFSISLGDAFIAALSIQKKAILVHKDPDFETITSALQQQPLPYKNIH